MWCGIPQYIQQYIICLACNCVLLAVKSCVSHWWTIQCEACSYLEWENICCVLTVDLLSFNWVYKHNRMCSVKLNFYQPTWWHPRLRCVRKYGPDMRNERIEFFLYISLLQLPQNSSSETVDLYIQKTKQTLQKLVCIICKNNYR